MNRGGKEKEMRNGYSVNDGQVKSEEEIKKTKHSVKEGKR